MEAKLTGRSYERILDGDMRWSIWARVDWKADELLPFVKFFEIDETLIQAAARQQDLLPDVAYETGLARHI